MLSPQAESAKVVITIPMAKGLKKVESAAQKLTALAMLGLPPFTTGNPFWWTKLLGFSIGRGLGDSKGVKETCRSENKKCPQNWYALYRSTPSTLKT